MRLLLDTHALLWWWADDPQLPAADGFGHLAVSSAHAWHAGSLAWPHRDPFDRMLAAQTMLDGLTLVTRDPVFAQLPVPALWSSHGLGAASTRHGPPPAER